MATEIKAVGVCGFGTMGAGIVQVCAEAGLDVVVLEASEERLTLGRERLGAFIEGGIKRGKVTEADRDALLGRIRGVLDVAELGACDLVVEAVVEQAEVKAELLAQIAGVVREDCLIATNTSALSVTELANAVPGPERFAGLHFFNPVPLMELVEVVEALQSSEQTLAALEELGRRIGKHPVRVKDRPGFLLNRVLMPYLNQVVQDYDDEIASAEDIDAALRLGLGYPMGALELLDVIGLDVHRHATEAAYEQTRTPSLSPPPLLGRMVAAGRLGRKSGRGFYDYEEDPR
ncbi:MAG TPA: 3-hydroxyacyl-CoA dehydrogenase NAD-binding domain-containing protein [Solirubrobacterales bacterium]|nr:3-hydroxyacyl-CoA dehydrogenase NAD-binding domain-containing protein [Solirubrobacterales bacterium]